MPESKILEVVEGSDGFYLYHNPSVQCAGMGDGVGQEFYYPPEDRVVTLMDGEDVFTKAWQLHIDEWGFLEYFEAYFHDLWGLEIYLHGPRNQWAFVVTGSEDDDEAGEVIKGVFVKLKETGVMQQPDWMKDKFPSSELEARHLYRLTAYTDLSYDEQAAIAAALEQYEEEL